MRSLAIIALLFPVLALAAAAEEKKYYFNLGASAVFPGKNSSTTEDSSSVLYGPSGAPSGTSLYTLPDVHWKNNYQTGFEVNTAIGHFITENVRIEGEFIYQRFDRDINGDYDWLERDALSGDQFHRDNDNPLANATSAVDLYNLMANAFYDFTNHTKWTPFIGAGIGISFIDSPGTTKNHFLHVEDATPPLDITAPSIEKSPDLYGTAFAWQVKLGVNYHVMDRMQIGILYRLLGTTKFKAGKSEIITNPDTPSETAHFFIPEQDVDGLLNHSANISLTYLF